MITPTFMTVLIVTMVTTVTMAVMATIAMRFRKTTGNITTPVDEHN